MDVRLSVSEIVLHDFEPSDLPRFQAALTSEITRLATQDGAATGTVGAASVRVEAGKTPEATAARVAASIFGREGP